MLSRRRRLVYAMLFPCGLGGSSDVLATAEIEDALQDYGAADLAGPLSSIGLQLGSSTIGHRQRGKRSALWRIALQGL